MEPQLTITTIRGIDRVTVHFDQGAEREAFDLIREVLPAVKDLDRRIRRFRDGPVGRTPTRATVPADGRRQGP